VYFQSKFSYYDNFQDFLFGFASNLLSFVFRFDELATQLSDAQTTGDQIEIWKIIGGMIEFFTNYEPDAYGISSVILLSDSKKTNSFDEIQKTLLK